MQSDRPSSTALLIAAAIIKAGRTPALAAFTSADDVRVCREWLLADTQGRRMLHLVESATGRAVATLCERLTLPGIALHYLLRKRFIAAAVRAMMAERHARLIVLGAGLDPLATRLALAGHDATEVDHHATQSLKRRVRATPTLRLVACDLARDALPTAALRGNGDTIVVAEGLLMYLDRPRIERLFMECRSLGERVRIIFTWMDRPAGGPRGFRPRSRVAEHWLRWRNEPFRSDFPAEAIEHWLSSLGYRLIARRSMQQLREEASLDRPGLVDGEHVAIAETF